MLKPRITREIIPRIIIFLGTYLMWMDLCMGQVPKAWKPNEVDHVFQLLKSSDVLSAVEFVETHGVTPYDFGMDLLEGLNESELALEWFVSLGESYPNLAPKYYFGKAWCHYKRAEYGKAIKDADWILRKNSPDLILARTHYLLALIHIHWHAPKTAKDELSKSLDIYQKLGKMGGQWMCTVEEASIAVQERDYEKAYKLLDRAQSIQISRNRLYPRVYELRGEIHFQKGEYDHALDWFRKAQNYY